MNVLLRAQHCCRTVPFPLFQMSFTISAAQVCCAPASGVPLRHTESGTQRKRALCHAPSAENTGTITEECEMTNKIVFQLAKQGLTGLFFTCDIARPDNVLLELY